jgi:hypothetical protein
VKRLLTLVAAASVSVMALSGCEKAEPLTEQEFRHVLDKDGYESAKVFYDEKDKKHSATFTLFNCVIVFDESRRDQEIDAITTGGKHKDNVTAADLGLSSLSGVDRETLQTALRQRSKTFTCAK